MAPEGEVCISGAVREAVGSDAYPAFFCGTPDNEIMSRFSPEAMVRARAVYERVIALSPRYARPHANLAFTYANEAIFGWTDDIEHSVRKGFEHAEVARRIDDHTPQLYLALANLHGVRLHWEDASWASRHAIELEPSYADGYVMDAIAQTYLGNLEVASDAVARAKRLNPHYSFIYIRVDARIRYLQGRYEEAARLLEDAVDRNPVFDQTHIVLAATYGQLGRVEDAQWEAEQVQMLQPDFTIAGDLRIRGFRDEALTERYAEGLREAGLPE